MLFFKLIRRLTKIKKAFILKLNMYLSMCARVKVEMVKYNKDNIFI